MVDLALIVGLLHRLLALLPGGPLPWLLLGLLLWSLYRLGRLLRSRSRGRLVLADAPGGASMPLLSAPRWGLRGRPDEVRVVDHGVWVPVEIKSHPPPSRGPYASHRLQLWAYCAILEEIRGVPPPFGLLIYADGVERRVPWDRDARWELARALAATRAPYRGEMDPSYPKCAHCRFRRACPGARSVGAAA